MNRPARQRGMTLLEILVSLLLAGITIGLASYLFLGAKGQMWLRGRDSQMLREAVYLRSAIEDSLQSGGLACAQDRPVPTRPDGRLPAWTETAFWKAKAPGLVSLELRCQSHGAGQDGEVRFTWRADLAYGKSLRQVRGIWTP